MTSIFQLQVVQWLVRKQKLQAAIGHQTNGVTPMQIACYHGHLHVAKWLHEFGKEQRTMVEGCVSTNPSSIYYREFGLGWTALHFAADKGRADICR